jgi:hypothetical protein
MAFWFYLIVASYLYLGLVSWNWASLSSSALILLGISGATALGAVSIDADKARRRRQLTDEVNLLNTQLANQNAMLQAANAAAQPNIQAAIVDLTRRLNEASESLRTLPTATLVSEGLLKDLVTDVDGVSLHRFQVVTWTLVLGFVFVSSVIYWLAMPEFDQTLLALMGISAGTYLGFKFPEKKG